MTKSYKRKNVSRFVARPASPLDAVVYRLDAVACEIETKWGMDTIWQLADPALAGKFHKALEKLDAAIQADDYDATLTNVENCIKGWRAMDYSATKNGYDPEKVKCRKVKSPGGVYYVFCDNEIDSALHVANKPEDAPITFSLAQVAATMERMSVVYNQSNEAIREATLKPVTFGKLQDDAIPF